MVVDVRPDSVRVDFGKTETPSAAPLNGKTKTTDPGKQVYGAETHALFCHLNTDISTFAGGSILKNSR